MISKCYKRGVAESRKSPLLVTMSRTAIPVKERVAATRERVRAAGRTYLNTDLPNELVSAIDKLKVERGASSRAAIIEDAVRLYIEQHAK